jgi:hypothetical protein
LYDVTEEPIARFLQLLLLSMPGPLTEEVCFYYSGPSFLVEGIGETFTNITTQYPAARTLRRSGRRE